MDSPCIKSPLVVKLYNLQIIKLLLNIGQVR